jgi:hypothetical protein
MSPNNPEHAFMPPQPGEDPAADAQPGAGPADGETATLSEPGLSETTAQTDETPDKATRKPSPMVAGLIAVGVLAVTGWGAFGIAMSRADSVESSLASTQDTLTTTADELKTVKDSLADVTSDRDDLQSQVNQIEDREQAAKKREDDVQVREDAVKKREDAATAAEQRVADNTFGSGTYQVGADIEPGTYRTDGGSFCYWARLSGGGGTLDDIIANNNVEGPATVTIDASDWGFENRGCGKWTKVG